MIESLKWRWIVIAITVSLSLAWVAPNFVDFGEKGWWISKEKIVLGLDIQGGAHLVLGVDVKGVLRERNIRMAANLKEEMTEKGLNPKNVIGSSEDFISLRVEVSSPEEVNKVRELISLNHSGRLQVVSESDNKLELRFYETYISEIKKQVISQAIEVIRNRIDEFGVSEPSISAQGEDRILVQLPGIKDSARAKELINKTAKLDFRIVVSAEETVGVGGEKLREWITQAEKTGGYELGKNDVRYSGYVKRLNQDLKSQLPTNTVIAFEKAPNAATMESGKVPFLLSTESDMGGADLEDAAVSSDNMGSPVVTFRLSPEGRRKFSKLTEANVGKQMAIVLDDVVQSAPNIREKIDSSSAQIELGGRDYKSAYEEGVLIATALRAGALPAALEQLEERTVGPSLGADSVKKAEMAGLIGTLLVFIFMLFHYRTLGIVADIALTLNLLFTVTVLTVLEATLTLPGIAGLVLTLGMSVDANVIIFERIKDELRKGSSLQAAIRDGFNNAFSAIFDSNVTTIATCIILVYFGSGPIRGFGVSLMAGIITSMFTAIFISRAILETMVVKWKMTNFVRV